MESGAKSKHAIKNGEKGQKAKREKAAEAALIILDTVFPLTFPLYFSYQCSLFLSCFIPPRLLLWILFALLFGIRRACLGHRVLDL